MAEPVPIDRLFKSGDWVYVNKVFSEGGVCYALVQYKKGVRVVTLENYTSATGESPENLPSNHYKYTRSEVKLQMSKKYISFRDHFEPVGEISSAFAQKGRALDIHA